MPKTSFENLTGLLAWLSEVYPERCAFVNNRWELYPSEGREDYAVIHPSVPWFYDAVFVEYLLREIIEVEDWGWEVLPFSAAVRKPRPDSIFRPTIIRCRAPSPVLALGSALRDAKGA